MKFLCFVTFLFVVLFASNVFAEKIDEQIPLEYQEWLIELKKEMINQGISPKTVEKAFEKNYYHKEPEVVLLDRKQPEFILTTTEYLNRVLNEKRVQTAQEKYIELSKLYKNIEKDYNVPLEYLIAFWGLETNFGANFGKFELIGSLTILSYDKRRPAFFKKELFEALKIIDKYDFELEKMTGSWAGAMGHFQFMPSTLNAYGVDFDGDGKIDIWDNFGDAIASAGNYLTKVGWKIDEPWGIEVSLNYNFDYSQSGLSTTKTVKEWGELGVRSIDGKKISQDEKLNGSIILPEGQKGKTYLVFSNFKKIMIWNRSENYALAISKLADYAKNGKKWEKEPENSVVLLRTEDILFLQEFINLHKIDTIDVDGTFGSKTKAAIKKLQKKAMFPDDGYPTYRLLRKIRYYDEKRGFAVPPQSQKPLVPISIHK